MKKTIASILFILFLLPLASASYISLTTTVKSGTIFNETTDLYVSIEQHGDEAAYDVSVVPLLPDFFSYQGSLSKERLDPQKKLEGNFTINILNKILPGQYPAVLKVIYHDANMYPFSTISPYLITYKEKVNSGVYGTISDLEIAKKGSGNLVLDVRNLDEIQHDINIKLYLPNELKSENMEKHLTIGPKEEKQVKYEVSSFGALTGSSYSIFASIEYEDDYHYTTFARGLVKIVEKKENPHFLWFLIVLFAVLLLVFVYFKIRSGRHEKKQS